MKKLRACLLISLLAASEAFVHRLSRSRVFGRLHPLHIGFMDYSPLGPEIFDDIDVAGCQIAKDKEYLNAILKEWNKEDRSFEIESKPFEYKDEEKGNLFGHLVRRKKSEPAEEKSLPGILLFHTGAGPLDVFLFHKADSLVQKYDCVVLICDIVSDCYGWAWSPDGTWYTDIRNSLLENDAQLLRSRATSAANGIGVGAPEVDPQRLAALGWCLGGQPILELGRVTSAAFDVRAMATFHGVFDRDVPITMLKDEVSSTKSGGTVLISNGKDDPMVDDEDLKCTKTVFEKSGWVVEIEEYEDTKHGFSNPAQALSEKAAFGYNEGAARKSWDATLQLLENHIF
uniref:Dienelactone hydrolase domain-containing protein n=1 Tax=Odontella aurita TaxID=265563 RepID=A0A7S4HSE1_9STRA|mmetsp:Transcript_14476/g.42412  ORF Transcript_14476/g.42412 Transcript_14476/m.42412 type:complete len:343 (+) Transcript_14476:127-1155(+)